ncbi:MAG: hypothetical protein WCC08_04840 [Terrimicrobiaceae bacterium]
MRAAPQEECPTGDIFGSYGAEREARPRSEMREEILYRLFVTLAGFLSPSGSFRRHPFPKPSLDREIVQRFVARSLQDFVE